MKRTVMRAMGSLALGCGLLACTPALNWRQVNLDTSGAAVLMPCKPDQATRAVKLRVATQDVSTELSMKGCEASNMQFTVGSLHAPQALAAADVIQAWRIASLASLNADAKDLASDQRMLKGAADAVHSHITSGEHQVQWLWFAHANRIYQVAVYGHRQDKALAETAETYFSGIQLP